MQGPQRGGPGEGCGRLRAEAPLPPPDGGCARWGHSCTWLRCLGMGHGLERSQRASEHRSDCCTRFAQLLVETRRLFALLAAVPQAPPVAASPTMRTPPCCERWRSAPRACLRTGTASALCTVRGCWGYCGVGKAPGCGSGRGRCAAAQSPCDMLCRRRTDSVQSLCPLTCLCLLQACSTLTTCRSWETRLVRERGLPVSKDGLPNQRTCQMKDLASHHCDGDLLSQTLRNFPLPHLRARTSGTCLFTCLCCRLRPLRLHGAL